MNTLLMPLRNTRTYIRIIKYGYADMTWWCTYDDVIAFCTYILNGYSMKCDDKT